MRLNEGESLKYIFEEHAILVETTEDVQNMMDEFERERSSSSNSRYNHVYILLPESPQDNNTITPTTSSISQPSDGRLARQSSEHDTGAAVTMNDETYHQEVPSEEPNKHASEHPNSTDDVVQDAEDTNKQHNITMTATGSSQDDKTADDNGSDDIKEQEDVRFFHLPPLPFLLSCI